MGPILSTGVADYTCQVAEIRGRRTGKGGLPCGGACEDRGVSSGWPTELSTFVGRAEELDAVGGELRRGGLITLVGPGGIGKTRLALRATAQYRGGPAHWFDLQAVQAEGLLGAVEAGLGTIVAPNVESLAAIASGLNGGRHSGAVSGRDDPRDEPGAPWRRR
jgi:hypothetical protein